MPVDERDVEANRAEDGDASFIILIIGWLAVDWYQPALWLLSYTETILPSPLLPRQPLPIWTGPLIQSLLSENCYSSLLLIRAINNRPEVDHRGIKGHGCLLVSGNQARSSFLSSFAFFYPPPTLPPVSFFLLLLFFCVCLYSFSNRTIKPILHNSIIITLDHSKLRPLLRLRSNTHGRQILLLGVGWPWCRSLGRHSVAESHLFQSSSFQLWSCRPLNWLDSHINLPISPRYGWDTNLPSLSLQ